MISPKAQLITQAADEGDLVQRMILADKAKQQGVVVNEAAVLDYLDRLYDVQHDNRPDYAAMLDQLDWRPARHAAVHQSRWRWNSPLSEC